MTHGLTKYPPGSLREFSALALPLILILMAGGLMELFDTAFLSRCSLDCLHGSVNAAYWCRVFQLPTTRIVLMGQVFIAFHKGKGELSSIGACVWQLIYFSLISMIIVIPCGLIAGFYFFKGPALKEMGQSYFYPLLLSNFLFPIGAALAAFHIGQGKSKIVALVSVSSYLMNIGLDYFLILGVKGLFTPLGLMGAAIAKITAQLVFCSILFYFFFKKESQITYGTNEWTFRPKLLLHYLRTGVPRALAAIVVTGAWAATAEVMRGGSEMHQMALSVGGKIILPLVFLYEGMGQALSTATSYSIGNKEYFLIWKTLSSALILLLLISAFLGIPFLLFPQIPLAIFNPDALSSATSGLLYPVIRLVWLVLLGNGISCLLLNVIFAFRETLFQLKISFLIVLTSFLPVYVGMNFLHWSPENLWLVMAIETFILSGCYLLRLRYRFKQLAVDQVALLQGAKTVS